MFKLAFLLLVGASSLRLNWKTDTLAWAREFWGPELAASIVKGENEFFDWCQEHFTKDGKLENPVGKGVKMGCSQIADLSEWGKLHFVIHRVIDAFPVSDNSFVVYSMVSGQINDCRTTFPMIHEVIMDGIKVASLKSFWDTGKLCGSQPWHHKGLATLDFIKGHGAQLDAAFNLAGGEMLSKLADTFVTPETIVKGPRALQGIKASELPLLATKVGITKMTHAFVDAFSLETSPNTIAAYAIATQSFGDCHVSHPIIFIYTFSGEKLILQQNYWDINMISSCSKKKEL
jgi:hypothetical protein